MKNITFTLALMLGFVQLFATNLQITNVEFRQFRRTTGEQKVKMTVRWDNAWRNSKNHDAAWIMVKFVSDDNGYAHARIAKERHRIIDGSAKARITVPEDQTGFFLTLDENYRGDVEWTIEVALDPESLRRVNVRSFLCRVYGVEMVYIPQGAFTLGDPDTTANRFGSFYQSDAQGQQAGLYQIASEDQTIEVGPEQGKLYYQAEYAAYQGDQKGPIPASYPKGYQAFYIMKYELQQGEYATFLNTLSNDQAIARANFGGPNYLEYRGSITLKGQQFHAASPHRPCNYVSWDDGLAFADWAGLRPMTELEFTKACRGTSKPIAGEYPWGTDNKDQLKRTITMDDELVLLDGFDESQLKDDNRAVFGASYYWVMDLAGSVWERVITIGDERGRAYTGQHGDGRINGHGYANVEDWPDGDNTPGGYGFRGGGYYRHGHNFNEFLPHSPIAYRTYGAWSGGYRTIAYSNRYVRTAR